MSIFPRLTRITSCYAASAAWSGVMPLIPVRALSTTTRFSSKSSSFCNFNQTIHQKRSQKVRNRKIFMGAWLKPPPPSRPVMCALIAYWNPPSQNSRSATAYTGYSTIVALMLPSFESSLFMAWAIHFWMLNCTICLLVKTSLCLEAAERPHLKGCICWVGPGLVVICQA